MAKKVRVETTCPECGAKDMVNPACVGAVCNACCTKGFQPTQGGHTHDTSMPESVVRRPHEFNPFNSQTGST